MAGNNKIIVLGALGMAGHIMTEYLNSTGQYIVYGVARERGKYVSNILDVTDFASLKEYLEFIQPAYVVNCIGVLVSQCRSDVSTAILLNSYLPHLLSEIGMKINYKLIHISTDCVFSGQDGQYKEDSYRDGDDNYARTKALGEVINGKDLTIRTSFIGPELKLDGTGFLDWFFKQQGSIRGYKKAYWTGVTTLELAKVTEEMIKQNVSGLYQICPAHKISKYALLKKISKVWNKKNRILPYEDYQIDKSLVCTRNDFIYPALEYEKMLIELKEWIHEHPEQYSHYDLQQMETSRM